MSAGFMATMATTAGWILLGVFAGMLILAFLWGWRPAQRIAFPLLDELTSAQPVWERDVARKDLNTAGAIRVAGLAIAFALVTGSTISAILDLVGQLATPAG